MTSPLALQIMRFGFLALLWLFVLASMRVIRGDLRASGQPRVSVPPPARRRGGRAPAPSGPAAPSHLLVIAGGMGGHAAGEVASKIVIGAMEGLDEDRAYGDLLGTLRETVMEANHRIADAVAQSRDLEGMGTTLTALRFTGNQVGLVHVGD